MKQIVDASRAVPIASPKDWSIIYIIVQGAGIVRVGDDAHQLANDPLDGIPLTAAVPAQQSFIWWKGNLFAIANAQTQISVQEPGKAPQGS